jgi:hypothetical protein
MKKMQEKSKRYKCTRQITGSPSNQVIGMANAKLSPQRSKMRRIEGFGENVSQLPLCVKHHLDLSLLNMVSQKVVSHFDVFGSPVENWVMGQAYGTGAITHEGYTLVCHSIISHSLHYPKYLGAAATYSTSVVDCATEDCL